MAKSLSSFSKSLVKAKTEEEVKHAYAERFGLDYDTEFRHDLYSPEILFEFKCSAVIKGGIPAPPSWRTSCIMSGGCASTRRFAMKRWSWE